MHIISRAATIEFDIFAVVMSFLPRADILQVALVCKLWSGYAHSVIWKTLDNLLPLVGLIRPLVQGGNGVWGFCNPFDEAQVTTSRFLHYAEHVREIYLMATPTIYDGMPVPASFSQPVEDVLSAIDPLLPNLTTVYYAPRCGPMTLSTKQIITSHSLTKLVIVYDQQPHDIEDTLEMLNALVSASESGLRLRCLHLHFHVGHNEALPTIHKFIETQPDIQELSLQLPSYERGTLEVIGGLPLRDLQLEQPPKNILGGPDLLQAVVTKCPHVSRFGLHTRRTADDFDPTPLFPWNLSVFRLSGLKDAKNPVNKIIKGSKWTGLRTLQVYSHDRLPVSILGMLVRPLPNLRELVLVIEARGEKIPDPPPYGFHHLEKLDVSNWLIPPKEDVQGLEKLASYLDAVCRSDREVLDGVSGAQGPWSGVIRGMGRMRGGQGDSQCGEVS